MKDTFRKYQNIHKEKENIKEMAEEIGVEESVPMIYKLYDASFQNTVELWKNEKKVCRTNSVKIAMGNKYPDSVYDLSLTLDSIINNLDDILDNELSEGKKALHLLEAGKNIGKMMSISSELNKKFMIVIESYFNHIIPIICGGEATYTKYLEGSKNESDIIKYCKKYYNSRIIDMDAFIEMPAIESGMSDLEIKKMIKLGRNFRALNLMKKDLIDIPEDTKNNTKTAFTILKSRGLEVKKYSNRLCEMYLKAIKEIEFKTNELNEIKQKFYEMAKKDMKEMESLY